MERRLTISPEELKKRLDNNRIEFMFDLRNTDEFEAWRIEGRSDFETLNIPQIDFVGEEERYFSRFPKNKEIIAICAHGDSSKYTAEMLQERGFSAMSLEGGMDLWSEFYETHKVLSDPDIYQIFRVAKGCMTHIVISEGEAVVIDAVRHVDKIMDVIESSGAKIKHVLDSHLQADHISGGRGVAALTGAAYHIHAEDGAGATYDFTPFKDGGQIAIGKCSLKAIHTPGHTPGSTSFLLNNKYLFSGDMLMKTSIGRPDLGGMADAWAVMLYDSLFKRLSGLPNDSVIFPTHAASIREQDENGVVMLTMGQCRRESELFRLTDRAAFVKQIKATLLENPARYQDIRKVNLGQLDPEETKKKELEIGKNLCGMEGKK